MRSIPLIVFLFGVLLVQIAAAAETTSEHHDTNAGLDEATPRLAVARCDESLRNRLYPAEKSRGERVVPAIEEGGISRNTLTAAPNAEPRETGLAAHGADSAVTRTEHDVSDDENARAQCAAPASPQESVSRGIHPASGNALAESSPFDGTARPYQTPLAGFSDAAGGSSTLLPAAGGAVSIWTALQSIPTPWTEYYEYDASGGSPRSRSPTDR